jgi:hypothetical protein
MIAVAVALLIKIIKKAKRESTVVLRAAIAVPAAERRVVLL